MRRAARVDANQTDVVEALRSAGATVRIITQGDGIPDLLVGFDGRTYLMELKDGAKPQSARKLTPAEQKFFDEWQGGNVSIVNSPAEALALILS